MAATTLRHEYANSGWVPAALAMVALAVGSGYALAVGELAGLYIALALLGSVAVLLDFRVGAVLLLLMLPMSQSSLFPRSLMQINGLNPLNLLLAATVASYVISGRARTAGPALRQPVLWLLIVPICVAAFIGLPHVHEVPAMVTDTGSYITPFTNERGYLVLSLTKAVVIPVIALMIGAAAARAQKPERFILAIAASAWITVLVQLAFIVLQGVPLADMAAPEERSFYTPIGMHANTLGRMHMFVLALLLFVWVDCRQPRLRLFLMVTMGAVALALVLTFSRAAMAGALLVGVLFLVWKFNVRSLTLVILGGAFVALLGGAAIWMRLTYGFGEGANAVSAGRIDGIWLPLLPELWKSPLWGNGLQSILWSFPMQTGAIVAVGHPHSAYLESLLDMGFLGTALLLAYFAHVWKGFRALSKDAALSPEMRALFQGASACLLAFFLTCIVGSSFRPEADSAYLWIAIGLMYGMLARRPAK
ncbi:MAG TPA: O-antigen ligase family protein [Burkholderiales bacterium]|jgi:O-antigen ligase|nr:O-antigen ligase family protein [Burkholderiales bacterium]